MESHRAGLLHYLPLSITRPLLGSSGGDYCLDLSSVLHVSLFNSFHLTQILCLFSVCRNWLTLWFVPCVIRQSLNALTVVTGQMIQAECRVTSTSHVSRLCCWCTHYFGHSWLFRLWSQTLTAEPFWEQAVEAMWARSELEQSSAALWLPLGSHRAPSGVKPAALAYQLLELYCSFQMKPFLSLSLSTTGQYKPF